MHTTAPDLFGQSQDPSFAARRDFHGFAQYLDASRELPVWRFCVCGFDNTSTGSHGECAVLRTDGSKTWVPIDSHDRITIAGRKYGRDHWFH